MIVCVLIALFPIITNTLFGLQSVDRGHHDLFTLHGASRWTRLRKLQCPAALPAIFTGLRISAGLAVIGAIVGDFFFRQGEPGLGVLIDNYQLAPRSPSRCSPRSSSPSLLGLVVFWVFGCIGKRVVGPWHDSTRSPADPHLERPQHHHPTQGDTHPYAQAPQASPQRLCRSPASCSLAACGSSRAASSDSSAATAAAGGTTTAAAAARPPRPRPPRHHHRGAAAGGAGSLKGVCPDQIVSRPTGTPRPSTATCTSWSARLHGERRQEVGRRPRCSQQAARTPASTFEVRSGGPAIGFQTVTAQLYTDDTITARLRVHRRGRPELEGPARPSAVFAPFDEEPADRSCGTRPPTPTSRPSPTSARRHAIRAYFGGGAYMDYLIGQRHRSRRSQIDGSYDGTPANFVAAGGKVAQQGFASAEPYIYENEVKEWGKPVDFQLIHDAGYPIYAESMSVRAADKSPSSRPA